MAALSLIFDLIGRDVSASKAFKDVGDSAEKAGKQGEGVGSLISGGMKMAAGALLGGGIIEGFKSLYDAAAESAKIGRITTQVIQSTGGAAKVTADQVGDLVTAISNKTGVDDEAIQSGANLLLTFTNIKNEAGKGNDIFTQTTQIMTDMSVALGTDASGSAIQLGKALNDPVKGVTALQKVGVSFTASQKDQIKTLVESGNVLGAQKVILAELSKEFGGAAAAASTPLDKLKVTAGNLAEQLGGYLIPMVDKFATFMLNNVLPAASNVAGVVGGALGTGFHLLGVAIGDIAGFAQGVASFFTSLPVPLQAIAVALGAIAAANMAGIFSGLASFGETAALKMLYLRDAIAASGTAMGAMKAAGSGLVSFLGGPVGLAIAAIVGSFALLSTTTEKNTTVSRDATEAQQGLAEALRQSKGAIDDNVRAAAAKSLQDAGILDAAQKAGVALPLVTDAILGNKDAYNQVNTALQNYANNRLIASGYEEHGKNTLHDQADVAGAAVDKFGQLAGTLGTTAAKQGQLAQATGQAGKAAADAADPTKTYAKELEDSAKSASDAKKQTDAFKLSLDILTGAHVSMLQVEDAFQSSVAAATEAMKKEGGSVLEASGALNSHSENGRKATDVLLGVRDSSSQLISTMIQQGATTDEVKAKDAELRKGFITSATQMGINRQHAEELANQILGIPAERNTKIDADVAQAKGDIAGVQKDVDNLHGKNIVVTVSGQGGLASYTTDQRNLLYSGKATGGPIFGPGTGTSDTAGLFALSNGEHVWTAKEVSAAGGHAAVESLRQAVLGAGNGMAAGGPVLINELLDSTRVDAMASAVLRAVKAAAAAFSSVGGNAGNRSLGQQIANAMGFGGQFNAIDYVFSRESGWNNNAQNPTSTAYGIPQFLNSTWAAYGGKTSDPATQIRDGIRYMTDRYGSPNGAAAFWQGHHWYDNGGWLQPGYTLAANGTGKPERIRTAEQEAALQRELSGSQSVVGIVVNGDVYADPDQLANRARIGTQRALATYGVRT